MPKSKKRRKTLIFGIIGLGLIALTVGAIVKKREVIISVQTEKVSRRNLTELVVANGKIQPVLQVKISPEVSGEIIALPVKEGQVVKKGDLILKIKPDFYIASRNQAEASYKSALAGKTTSIANLEKANAEFKRNQELYERKLISDSVFVEFKTGYEIARAQLESANHQVDMSKALLARADEELAKTTIVSPLDGTVSKLNSQLGERVVGTATMAGTEVMTIADLNEMEARVDIGEIDVVLIAPAQIARLEVDAFKDRKFTGTVTEIANSSRGAGLLGSGGGGGTQQEATKFEVRIRINEKEAFRPGMSITAEIETRYRTNVLAVPIASITTRLPKDKDKDKDKDKKGKEAAPKTVAAKTNEPAGVATSTSTNSSGGEKKKDAKPIEVVFLMDGERAKMMPVKIGISDDTHWEVVEGLQDGQDVVSGGYRAISRDLEDGKRIKKGAVIDAAKDEDKKKSE